MYTKIAKTTVLGLAALLAPTLAFAHPGLHPGSGILQGFTHPLTGLDHILAMVAVGLLAFQMGGRALWLLPATFVLVMAGGGALGAAGIEIPAVEIGIALSVVVLGAVVASNIKMPVALAMGMVGFFAILHGHAHGAEMVQGVNGFVYAAGFMTATALLHVAGISLGALVARTGRAIGPIALRTAGGVAVVAGVGMLSGLL
jgi:urease accessory protein